VSDFESDIKNECWLVTLRENECDGVTNCV
jgi:hypothetical protein